jgi:hypothetical protein
MTGSNGRRDCFTIWLNESPRKVGSGKDTRTSATRPSLETKEALLEKALAELDAREKRVRENYEQICAAINQAMPLREILDSLLDEDASAAQER